MEFIAGRELDIYIAKLAGWYIERASIHSPEGTLHAGDYLLHSKPDLVLTTEQEQAIWESWGPSFTTDLRYAFSLPIDGEDYFDLHSPTTEDPVWRAFITDYGHADPNAYNTPDHAAFADTGALALCLAWLQYIGATRRIAGLQPSVSEHLSAK